MTASPRQLWARYPAGINAGLVIWACSAVVATLGAAMLLVSIVGAVRDGGGWPVYVATGLGSLLPAGLLLVVARPPGSSVVIRARDVFVTVTAAWTVAALVAAIPIEVAGHARSYTAAVFEAMSGFTTTGATVFDSIEPLPDSVLLWRSLIQWLGGIGIIVLLVGIAPALGIGSTRALFAELSGPTKERYTPRISQTARALVRIYLVLTVANVAAYIATGMTTFDAVCHAMTTISTGGFSTHTASLAHFGDSTQLAAIVFMILGGINFGIFILISMSRRPTRMQRLETIWYLIALAAFTLVIVSTLVFSDDARGWSALLDSAFTVVSIVTTTGYVTADFDAWNETARTVLLCVMFVGGSAGSTVGGIKIVRWMMLGAAVRAELRRLMHPSAIVRVRLGDRHFSDRDVLTLTSFVIAYLVVFVTAAVGVAAVSDLDLISAISASAASITLVGPGLGQVGASESYSAVSDPGMAILAFTMLLGRLEVFTVLALLTPAFWRRR